MNELARLEFDRVSGVPVARVLGEIDLSNAGDVLESSIEGAFSDNAGTLLVDLSSVTYMDSAGIRALFELGERLAAVGKRMITIVPEESPIRRVLELADAPTVIALQTDLEGAVAALS